MLGGLDDYVAGWRQGWTSLQRFAGFWGPVSPLPSPLQPLAVLGTILALAIITGVALSSLAVFVTSLLLLYLLMSQVLGIEISVVA